MSWPTVPWDAAVTWSARSRARRCGRGGLGPGARHRFPGRGYHWGPEAVHPTLPRGDRVHLGTVGTLTEIVNGPSRVADGTMNVLGAIRKGMATAGYTDLKEFQRVEVVLGD